MDIVTEQVFFRGNVQRVGFRCTAERLANGLPVKGFVRNLVDGQVELVVTGDRTDISRLVDGLKDHFGEGIAGVERRERLEVEQFSGFSIRR